MTFNLVSSSWVPAIVEGKRTLVSVREMLTDAANIDGLALEQPLEAAAVFRQILLPVYLDACRPPKSDEQWVERWGEDLDTAAIVKYLDTHEAAFELFDVERPFGQVAGLRTDKGETKPVSLLIAAISSGNNVPLFGSRLDNDPPVLTPGQAALALLAAQCWDTAAIKSGAKGDPKVKAGKTTGNHTGPLGGLGVAIPFGRNFKETLLLNTPVLRHGFRDDRPQWISRRSQTPEWESRSATGLLDLLTWQSRRIRLIPEQENGELVVRQVVLTAGDRLENVAAYEPHSAWKTVEKPKAGQPAVRPVRHVPGRAVWRGLESLLAARDDSSDAFSTTTLLEQLRGLVGNALLEKLPSVRIFTVGVAYGSQSAVVEDVMADVLPLPLAALDPSGEVKHLLDNVADQADALRTAANQLVDNLRLAQGSGEKLPWDKGQRLGDVLVHQLDPVVRRMLSGLQTRPEQITGARKAWAQTAAKLALGLGETALEAAHPSAVLGRKDGKNIYQLTTAERWFKASVRNVLGLEKPVANERRGDA